MAALSTRALRRPLHPLHAIFLAFPLPLFLGALISDIAYYKSFHVQWINFAQWLLAGGLLVGALALLWTAIELIARATERTARAMVYCAALLVMWVLGLIDSFVHAKDAWASMPTSLYLSTAVTVLALVATCIGYSGLHADRVH